MQFLVLYTPYFIVLLMLGLDSFGVFGEFRSPCNFVPVHVAIRNVLQPTLRSTLAMQAIIQCYFDFTYREQLCMYRY